MNSLAFDTSLSALSCAVRSGEMAACYKRAYPMHRGQSEALIPEIDKLLNMARLEYKDLDLIVTSLGPGAFTGLRIGLSCAKAFEVSLDCPVIGLGTLDILARQISETTSNPDYLDIWVVLETKRKDFYAANYNAQGGNITAPACYSAQQLEEHFKKKPCLVSGDGIIRLGREIEISRKQLVCGYNIIDPAIMIQLGKETLHMNELSRPLLEPVYLKEPGISAPKQSPRQLRSSIS